MQMSEARAGGMEGQCLSEMDRQFAECIVGELPRTRKEGIKWLEPAVLDSPKAILTRGMISAGSVVSL